MERIPKPDGHELLLAAGTGGLPWEPGTCHCAPQEYTCRARDGWPPVVSPLPQRCTDALDCPMLLGRPGEPLLGLCCESSHHSTAHLGRETRAHTPPLPTAAPHRLRSLRSRPWHVSRMAYWHHLGPLTAVGYPCPSTDLLVTVTNQGSPGLHALGHTLPSCCDRGPLSASALWAHDRGAS